MTKDFNSTYRAYFDSLKDADDVFGFDIEAIEKIEPLLSFLYKTWWRVKVAHLDRIPNEGPALIVGNTNGLIPWPALMLMYALMSKKEQPRRLHILANLDSIENVRIRKRLEQIGFVPWSSTNMKYLFSKGELVATFPEGVQGLRKPFSERYRLREFDWTRILPAVEEGIKIFPLATLGCDESVPTFGESTRLAKLAGLPAMPLSPFFPWLPFPLNLASLPVSWKMTALRSAMYPTHSDRDTLEETAKSQSKFAEGEIQAELNRLLRTRLKHPQ